MTIQPGGIIGSLSLPLLGGCAFLMAAHLPEERSPDLLKAGVDSSWVDRNYGYPIAAGLDASGCNVEQIQFVDGVSKGQRQARIVVHGVLDYCTLCIWEVVATPFEVCAWAIGYPSYVYYLVYDDDGKQIGRAHV